MKKLTKGNLEDLAKVMPVLSEEEQKGYVGGNTVNVVMNRVNYGPNATLSSFTATSYDVDGKIIGEITGYMLEPSVSPEEAQISGSGAAISAGTYNIIESTFHGKSGYYELQDVPGRYDIKIHPGNTADDTSGCLMPGGTKNTSNNDPTIGNSRDMTNQLFDMFKEHGDQGIKIQINDKP